MNASELPLNQTVVFASNEKFRTTVTRVSEDWVEFIYYDQATNDSTLTMRGRVDGLSSEIVNFDRSYWNFTINGRPATSRDVDEVTNRPGLSAQINPEDRIIAITMK